MANAPQCGYVEPEPTPEPITTYNEICENYSVYREKYIDGVYIDRELVLANAPQCGYDYVSPDEIIPDDPPEPVEPMPDEATSTYIYIIVGVAISYFITSMR